MRKRAFHLFGMLIFALDMQFSLQLYGLSAVIETIDHRQTHSLQLKLVFVPASKAIIDDCLVQQVQCFVCMIFGGILGAFVLLTFHQFLSSLKLTRRSEWLFTIFGSFTPDGAHFMCFVLFQQSLLQLLSVAVDRINSLSDMIKTIIVDYESILTVLMVLLRFVPLIRLSYFLVGDFVQMDGVHVHKRGLSLLVLVLIELVLARSSVFLGCELRSREETAESPHGRKRQNDKINIVPSFIASQDDILTIDCIQGIDLAKLFDFYGIETYFLFSLLGKLLGQQYYCIVLQRQTKWAPVPLQQTNIQKRHSNPIITPSPPLSHSSIQPAMQIRGTRRCKPLPTKCFSVPSLKTPTMSPSLLAIKQQTRTRKASFWLFLSIPVLLPKQETPKTKHRCKDQSSTSLLQRSMAYLNQSISMSLSDTIQAMLLGTKKRLSLCVMQRIQRKLQKQTTQSTKNGFRLFQHDSNKTYQLFVKIDTIRLYRSLYSHFCVRYVLPVQSIHNNCLNMKQTIDVDSLPSLPVQRGARRPRIINNSVVFDSKSHHSLKKLMQLKMLPPLPNHPQTDSKAKVMSKNCPEEIHDSVLFQINQPELLPKRTELQSFSTAKFGFDEVTIDSDRKDSTIELEVADSAGKGRFKKPTQMGVTFGKVGRLEKHRYTEMQEEPAKAASPYCKSKFMVPKINLEKLDRNGFKLGRYDSIFKPNSPKELHTIDTIANKPTRNSQTPILLARLKQKGESLLPPILLRVQPH